MGIIDTLSAGFTTVNRRPWLLLLPVLLDLFLWLGPQLSAGPVVSQAVEIYRSVPGQAGQSEVIEQLREMAQQVAGANVFAVLTWQLPSIITSSRSDLPGSGLHSTQLAVSSPAALVLWVVVLLVLGLLGTSLYLSTIALGVRGERIGLDGYVRRLWLNFRRLTTYFLLLLGFLLLFGLPLVMVVGLVGLISPAVAGLLFLVLAMALLWLFLYLFFVNYAIFAGNRGPVQAISESVRLVARHFWAAVALFILVHLILLGTSIAWGAVLRHPLGVMAAIAGNAYIASGLAAASMIFYRDRVETSTSIGK